MSEVIIKGIECPDCHDRIWSRGTHDFRYCKCKGSFVDGGREYLRVGGAAAHPGIDSVIDFHLQPRDARVWLSEGQYLTHAEMETAHIKNVIIHLFKRIDALLGRKDLSDQLREIIVQMKEELAFRGEKFPEGEYYVE